MNLQLDEIDRLAVDALDGYLVRKDLVRTFSRQFPVPTYVVEFLLGRYCASVDPVEIEEGLEVVQRQLQSKTVKAGEQELFKSRAREQGQIKLIDLVTARLDTKSDSYLATLPSLQLRRTRCCCAWCRSSSATTTWWSWGRAARARATCSSRCRRMPT
jgi:ATP-dependent Lon protease